MMFCSTHNRQHLSGFSKAVLSGLAPDGGLYFPEEIPSLDASLIRSFARMSLGEIGFEVMRRFVGDDILRDTLEKLMHEALNFDIPLVEVEKDVFALELFHGPTLAFKDVGARVMSRMVAAISKKPTTVLVATSGDTGSAVARGFLGVEGVRVVLLFPKGKISKIQEKQLTTLGQNITALEVDGVFDDCQTLVKRAFLDAELQNKLRLTSANSINIARWLPQSIYYFHALSKIPDAFIAVPSGNFGNLTAGILARKMGASCRGFIAATNANTVVPDFLESGNYHAQPSIATLANAMDVGDPSNFVRLRALFKDDQALRRTLLSFSAGDAQIIQTISRCFGQTKYVLDPHGAVAYEAVKKWRNGHKALFLETAHPAKFKGIVESATGETLDMPKVLQDCLDKPGTSLPMSIDYESFKAFLMDF